MSDRLRPLWDFDDLDATEGRLREQLAQESGVEGRAEVLTQLARVEGLRGDFDTCEQLLREAEMLAGDSDTARVRVDLERGRKLRSSGDGAASVPLFKSAFARALEAELHYLAGDAAHMVAIAVPEEMLEWTERGLALADAQPDAAYWTGPLLNNLGWHHYEAGDHEAALTAFERALEVRERDPTNVKAIGFAKEAVETARAALAR
ncbi:MAG: tetratricopeptide repeat protein [Thermoleophilia bacterium]|nr:tetratricopeptide repeat protein [Thermoleophilia bacterium]